MLIPNPLDLVYMYEFPQKSLLDPKDLLLDDALAYLHRNPVCNIVLNLIQNLIKSSLMGKIQEYPYYRFQFNCSIYLEEPIRLPSPHWISFSVCLSVCSSIIYENTLNFRVGIKIRVSTWSFLSIVRPPEYLFLCTRRKFGLNKKIRRKSLIVYVYYQPNSCTMYHTPVEY